MAEENIENRPTATTSQDVQTLLQQIANKDAQSLDALYDTCSGILMSVIMTIISERTEAEDILQETFITIWNKAEMYQPHLGKPTSWLVTIAKNKAYDKYRKKVRQQQGLTSLKDSLPTQTDTQQPQRNNEALEHCFQKLNQDQQTAVNLVFYQGLTQQETSAQLDTPLGTVKARIRRGLIQLQQCLSNQ